MANEYVPWMIGGGVLHPVEVARLVAFIATNGGEGTVGPASLEVRAQAAPNGTIRVSPGACAIHNRATGAAFDTYAARFPVEVNVAIAATGSGGSRTDLVVARIENPYETGEPWDEPDEADLAAGTAVFNRIAVISGVPADTDDVVSLNLGYSAIALARITLPPSTATVLQAHITDLRTTYVSGFSEDPGTVKMSASATIADGWLLCDGSSQLRTDYPALYAAIGTAYGSVDGTHFTLPDLRGRFPLGISGSHPRGQYGGEEFHTLTQAEMPSHNHGGATGIAGLHNHGYDAPAISTAGGGANNYYRTHNPLARTSNDGDHQHAIGSEGGGAPHNNMPPCVTVNYLIKT